jgi:diguanylate cyclase (GGDEF)-like protein/PAS domain S-box-containing protein
MPMDPTSAPIASHAHTPWWRALHAALMPDYNRKAATYWWFMVMLGLSSLGIALHQVVGLQPAEQARVVVGCAVAMLAGLYPVRIPGSKNSFAAGEIFIFLLLLMHGPAAAVLAAAGEALVGSMRSSKRWTSRLVSPALAAIAMGAAGNTLHAAVRGLRAMGMLNEVVLLLVAMTFAIGYFLLNTALITVIPHLKRNEPMRLRALMGSFGWVGITYAASSLIAGLLFLTFEQVGIGVLTAAVPIIAMLLAMLHVYFRKRELDDATHRVRLEAAEREAEQTARHLSELGVSEQRFHSAFSNAAIGMALVSVNGQVLQANGAMLALVGRGERELMGCEFGSIVNANDAAPLAERLAHCALGSDAASIELRINHPKGQEVWVSIHIATFADGAIAVPRLILQAQDITARRSAETRLQHIAYHDSLTGLCNRVRFRDSLATAIERCHSNPTRGFAVMYLDFDRFKLINDTLGHSAGDQFLVTAAQRIVRQVRPADIVGRLGGDEFAILIEQTGGEEMALALAERLQQALREPFQVEGTEVNSSASIGITFSSVGYQTPDEVLRDADIAMYRAKAGGRARHALFDTALRSQLSEQVRLEADLRLAIEHDEITLAFQPIFDLASGRIVSFEALARWTHAERGPVPPALFVAVAEESGLIGKLTERILSLACQQLRRWQASTGNPLLRMQVNLSGIDLCHGALATQVAGLLRSHGIEASQLTLEITESKLMTQLERALETLTRLRDIGVGLSVDDFGTGYSSLSYLSTLPISSLKVDRSFVNHMMNAAQDAEIVRAIISLGNALGKTVIAEGIETSAQLAQLRARGCRFGQGYFLAPPMPGDEALQLLHAERDMAAAPTGGEYEHSDYLGSGIASDGASVTIH